MSDDSGQSVLDQLRPADGWGEVAKKAGQLVLGVITDTRTHLAVIAAMLVALVAGSIWAAGFIGFQLEVMLFWGLATLVLGGAPIAIMLLMPGMPRGLRTVIGRLFALLAQLGYAGSAIVQRDLDARVPIYEQRCLQTDEHGYYVETSDDTIVRLADDEVYKWAFQRFALIAEKGDNVESMAVSANAMTDGGAEADGGQFVPTGRIAQGYPELRPTSWDERWLVDLAPLRTRLQNSAAARLSREGKQEALEKEGGKQELGMLWTLVLTLVSTVTGALMVWLTMGGA